MNARKAAMMTSLTVGLFTMKHPALAQEAAPMANGGCEQVHAQKVSVFDQATNTTAGRVIKGGILNGTTQEVFTGAVSPTPDPTTVSFIADFTLTTNRGQLKASNVYLFDFVAGAGAVLLRINPATSTGRFAGATGVLFTAVTLIGSGPDTFQEEMTGEICLARQFRSEGSQDR